jgi:prolyl 4-hydroxylase
MEVMSKLVDRSQRKKGQILSPDIRMKTCSSMLTIWLLLLQLSIPSLILTLSLLPIVPAFTVTTWLTKQEMEQRDIMKIQRRVPSPSNSYLTSLPSSLSKEIKESTILIPERRRTNRHHRNHVDVRYKNDYNPTRKVVLSASLEKQNISHSRSSLRNSLYKAKFSHPPSHDCQSEEAIISHENNKSRINNSPLLSSLESKDGIIRNYNHDDNNYFWRMPRSKKEIVQYVQKSLSSTSEIVDENDIHVLSVEPPLLMIDNFLSAQHCEAIVHRAKEKEMARSTTGSSNSECSHRTSDTAWLHDNDDEDYHSSQQSVSTHAMRFLTTQVANLSGLPATHHENLQVARYQTGQKFMVHTDHMDAFNELHVRARLATCLMYLNSATTTTDSEVTPYSDTNVSYKENCLLGGNTYFPEYDISISPKIGRAVFWWNTLQRPGMRDYHPYMFLDADMRMRHEGQPVTEGEKWICNRWIHPIDIGYSVKGL